MSNFRGLYDIRDYKESDKAFIKATFLRGLYHGKFWYSLIPRDIFMKNYSQVADRLLADPRVRVQLAVLKEDPDTILGYCIISRDTKAIIWLHTKAAWQNRGIATSLIPCPPLYVMHLSAVGNKLLTLKFPNALYNPFYDP
jgi:hypothetical protein